MTVQQSISPRVYFWLLITWIIFAFSPLPADAGDVPAEMPENWLSIAFNPAEASMTGTAKIILPPGTPLTLYSGDLDITGAVLEVKDKTPRTLKSTRENTIRIPTDDTEQTILVSWRLTGARGMGDNLISPEGITLAGFWHPLPDIDMAYRLEARLPDNFTAISEGDTVTYCLDNFNNRYLTTLFNHPVRSIHFAAGPYKVKTRNLPGDILLSAFFFPEDLHLADEYLNKAEYYLNLYQELIGPYPYNRYSIVENRLPTGYGMPTFTLLGQAVVRLPFIKDTSLGHEVLHSWFGNSVMLKESSGNWTEGLTTYLADQYYAELAGEDDQYRKNQLLRYDAYVHGDNEMTLTDFSSASHSQPLARKVRAVGYDKSSMVFHMLRRRLGDDLFFRGLSRFYEQYRFRKAGWEEIEDTFSEVSDADLADFFTQWLTRWDIPKLQVDKVDVKQEDGRSKVVFTLEQKTVQPYSLLVPVVIRTGKGTKRESVEITGSSRKVEISVDSLPVELAIDPDYDLMRTLSLKERPAIWAQFMGARDKIAVLADDEMQREIYEPLFPLLKQLDCDIVTADELDNDDLDEGSFLFLGKTTHSLGLFADPGHSADAVTLDMRQNPLAPDQVMVLFTSFDPEQTASVVRKLSHYGKYSFISFVDGQAVEKKIYPSAQGIRLELFSNPKGVKVPDIRSFDEIIDEMEDSRVIYVGEMHTDLGSHLLQLQVIQALFAKYPDLAIGMEMFPRTSQDALDAYINGEIETESEFIKKSEYFDVWGFDYRYYRDIIGYAHRHGIPLVGLNIEKSIVSTVFREGDLDSLEDEMVGRIPTERKLDTPGYSQRLSLAFSAHNQQNFSGDQIGGFIKAQSIWDETMAETIVTYLQKNPKKKMVVIAGNGHIYKDSAIPPRVARRMDVQQSVLSSINFNSNILVPGYQVDYLLYTESLELTPAPKIGIVLDKEEDPDDPDKTRLRILQVSPHGKAGDAGLEKNDIILTVDGRRVEAVSDLKLILMDKEPGDTVSMKILREHTILPDEELKLDVELSNPMSASGLPPSHPR